MICTQLDNARAKIYGKYTVSMQCEVQHNICGHAKVLIPSVKTEVCFLISVSTPIPIGT